MKHTVSILICWLIPFLGIVHAGQSERIRFEIFGGLFQSSPEALNQYSRFNQSYQNNQINNYLQQNSPYSTATLLESHGELKEIRSLQSLGGRLRFRTGMGANRLSLSVAVNYIWNTVDSENAFRISLDSFYQGSAIVERSMAPHRIWTKAWIPTLGIHSPIWRKNKFGMEIFMAAGPVLASCGAMNVNLYHTESAKPYIYDTEKIQEIKGKGVGFSLEGGGRIQFQLYSGITLFAEGGYRLQKVSSIEGDGYIKNNYKDNNSDGYSTRFNYRGKWITQNSGNGSYPTILPPDGSSADAEEFRLNLSAFYLHLGISLRLF